MKVGAYYMKCNVYIGTNHEEEINIYSKEKTALVDEIVKIVKSDANEIIAINENKEKFIQKRNCCSLGCSDSCIWKRSTFHTGKHKPGGRG